MTEKTCRFGKEKEKNRHNIFQHLFASFSKVIVETTTTFVFGLKRKEKKGMNYRFIFLRQFLKTEKDQVSDCAVVCVT